MSFDFLSLEQALQIVKAAGYKVSKPRKGKAIGGAIEITNPFNHPYPHAKLRTITLTSITRLSKGARFGHSDYKGAMAAKWAAVRAGRLVLETGRATQPQDEHANN